MLWQTRQTSGLLGQTVLIEVTSQRGSCLAVRFSALAENFRIYAKVEEPPAMRVG